MADLIAIGYPDVQTAEAVAAELERLASGTVLKTSLPKEVEQQIQQAISGSAVGASAS